MQGAPRPRVLVIDDQVFNSTVLKGMLEQHGFQALTASSGEQGRELAVAEQPELILLDIMMPAETGFETCAKLQQDPATMDIPIIFISALTEVDTKVKGLEMGAVDYITKPFEMAEVLARVRLHLRLKLATKALIEEQAAKLRQISEAQQAMLVLPGECPGANFAIRYNPVLEAGGDFYDVFPLSDRTHCYFVADISGHDLGTSLVTSSLKALVRQNSGPLFTPMETMKTMNSVLGTVLGEGRYVTAQSLYVNRSNMSATLANAGHPPPVYVPASGEPRFLESTGDVLGAFNRAYLEPITFRVAQGDRIILYTDGLVERFGDPFRGLTQGCHHLLEACARIRSLDLESSVEEVYNELLGRGHEHEDDVVLLGVEV